jgi:thymidylate synthase (FAD)
MKVELIDHMGSDLSVVNAARVSFDKESDWEYGEICEQCNDYHEPYLSDKDAKLISYLAKHNHWSPSAHAFASFRIKAPIFVARQLVKHQVGLAWNEVSRRYVDSEPEFYTPDVWRKRADNVKQGSSDEAVDIIEYGYAIFQDNPDLDPYECFIEEVTEFYQRLLSKGVCPEQARMVLPASLMTEWIWSGSLFAFARVCKLRLDPHTQKETQVVAQMINDHMADLFPVSWKALQDG